MFFVISSTRKIAVLHSSEKEILYQKNYKTRKRNDTQSNGSYLFNMRVSPLPVFSIISSVMGNSLAALAICNLGNKSFLPFRSKKLSRNIKQKIFRKLISREREIKDKIESSIIGIGLGCLSMRTISKSSSVIKNNWTGPLQIGVDDMECILTAIWGYRCCVTRDSVETMLELVRWNMAKPSTIENLVLFGSKALSKFEKFTLLGDGRSSIPICDRNRINLCLKLSRNEYII